MKSLKTESVDTLPSHQSELRAKRRTSTPPPPVKKYEELEGGLGKEINFRPPRIPSAELGPVGAVVEIRDGDGSLRKVLHDVSQNGVAFEWEDGAAQVGDHLPEIVVSFDGHEAYRGEARVSSVRVIAGKQIVGASFLDTLMNVDDVLQLRDVKLWGAREAGSTPRQRPWRVPGHEAFKARTSELRLLFEDAEQHLRELETSLPWHVTHGDHESPARAALVERMRRDVVEDVVALYVEIGALYPGIPVTDHPALKEWSLRHLDDAFMQSPWVRRAYEKPLGYPGDFELMNGLYGNHFSGSSLFAKAVNMAFVSVPAARAVVERKNLVRARLDALLDSAAERGRSVRILSIAAGPAQEVYELLERRTRVPCPVEIVLFDQDRRALGFAYSRIQPLAARFGDQVSVVYLHDTIKRLLRDANLFSPLGTFDAIFSCGLFDYLPQPTATTLTASLYQRVAPGGSLYIGNQTPASTSRWAMEFHCDWYLIYREHEQMLEFARAGAPGAAVSIVEEPTGINPFVVVKRE
ncbi:MAG TPA: hypothetical protein VHE30_28360 [Polyangiaceae bacterium]|nr:hypothetical protein [Polyangiaceae bacterium]